MLRFAPWRRRFWVGAPFAPVVVVAAAVACTDLFHSTEFPTACTPDANAAGCSGDVCAANHATAVDHAKHACALLSACESPLGENAPGRCIEHAIPVFDCAAMPNMLAHDEVRAVWRCLRDAASCTDVDRCIFKNGPVSCADDDGGGSTFVRCGDDVNPDLRLDCRERGAAFRPESCLATGRTCAQDDALSKGTCGAGRTLKCLQSECDGTAHHVCDAQQADLGVDCIHFGAGECVTSIAGGACRASGTTTCTPTSAVTCQGDVAVGCPSGYEERVDCAALSGPGTCRAIADGGGTPDQAKRPYDVTRACAVDQPCEGDRCSEQKLFACVYGVLVETPCPGGGGCATQATADGPRASCAKP